MRANLPSDPAKTLEQWLLILRRQPRLAILSYGCALLGMLFAVHDFHHYNPNRFGLSTIFLGAAILLYIFSLRRAPGINRPVPKRPQPRR